MVIVRIAIEPAGPAIHPLPVNLAAPCERLCPAPDRNALVLLHRHRPVGERERRALLKEARVVLPPAVVALDHPVDSHVGPAGEPLEILDGELRQIRLFDYREQVRLLLRHLRFLPARRAVQEREDIVCRVKIRLVCVHAKSPVLARFFSALHEEEGRVALDQVVEHIGVAPVADGVEPDSLRVRDDHPDHLTVQDLPDGPADHQLIGLLDKQVRVQHLPVLLRRQYPGVLLGGFVDPAGEHPVHHLIVTGPFLLCNPPDAPLGDRADPGGQVFCDRRVRDRLVEVRGRRLQDLLYPVRELGVVAHQDRAGPEVLHVIERLVAHRALHLVRIRHLAHHLSEGVGLALAGIPGHGDMQAIGIFHGLRCHRKNHAAGNNLVADMLLRESPQHQRDRVAVFQHIERGRALVGRGRDRGRSRIDRTVMLDLRFCPVLPPGLLPLLPVLALCCPIRLELLAEFLPPLGTAAAGIVLAAGEDRAASELDRKSPVLVGRRERALVEHEKRPAAVRFL